MYTKRYQLYFMISWQIIGNAMSLGFSLVFYKPLEIAAQVLL